MLKIIRLVNLRYSDLKCLLNVDHLILVVVLQFIPQISKYSLTQHLYRDVPNIISNTLFKLVCVL